MKAFWLVASTLGTVAFVLCFLRTAVELYDYHLRRKHSLLKKRAIRLVRWGM
jgi:hypothetical protein